MPSQSGLQRSNTGRSKDAKDRAKQAIIDLKTEHKQVNFSTVALKSGVARSFLYADEEVKKMIEEHRKRDVSSEINKRARFDKTAKSKDVIIETKDRRIAALVEENTKLKAEISILRGMVYADSNKVTSRTCSRREECSKTGG